jgi:putative transposase
LRADFRSFPSPSAAPGPKPGKKHASAAVIEVIDREIVEIFLKRPPPAIREAANQIRGLLIADTGDHRFDMADVPSVRTIERMIGEISSPQLARSTMGSKRRTAHEPHPGEYLSEGLDVVQMDHSPANVMLVDNAPQCLGRPRDFADRCLSRCIIGFYVSFGDPSIFRWAGSRNALLRSPCRPDDETPHGFFKRLRRFCIGASR